MEKPQIHFKKYSGFCFLLVFTLFHVLISNLNASAGKLILDADTSYSIPKIWSTDATEPGPKQWKANWIWQKKVSDDESVVLLARKVFRIESDPGRAVLYITADSYYEVYINGTFLNRGPARCAPHHQSYDIMDITSVLKTGENVLAMKALNRGRRVLNATSTSRPGILVQMEIEEGGKNQIITTDSTWKVKSDGGISIYAGAYGELTDFRKEEKGWKDSGFNDSGWDFATVLLSDMFWPAPSQGEKPKIIVFPWLSLVPRDIPYLSESLVLADQLYETGEVLEFSFSEPIAEGAHGLFFPKEKNPVIGIDSYRQQKGPLTILNNYPSDIFSGEGINSTYLIFDVGELMHGYPKLEIEGEAGTIVEVIYAPHLLREKFPLRTDINQRPMTDRIILGRGKTLWDAVEMRDLRYMMIAIRNTDKPVLLHFVGLIRVDYPFTSQGSFSVNNDDELEWLWKASLNTLNAVATDAYVDNYREKRQYSQTSYYTSRASYAAFGDKYLQRRYLVQIAQEQESDGFLPVSSPKETNSVGGFIDGSIFWLMGLHDYYLHTGDLVTLNELLPAAERLMNMFKKWESDDGLIYSPPYSYWIDHSNLDRSGANFCLNSLYILIMQDYMKILEWTGNDSKTKEYLNRISNLRSTMCLKFWDTDKKLFSDALVREKLSATFSEHSNSLAIVAGVANREQEKEIMKEFLENKSARLVPAVLFMHFVTESIFMSGHGKEALLMLKDRYRHMKAEGSMTIWEEWSITVSNRTGKFEPNNRRAYAQGENTFPASSLSRWLVGIQPLKPGMTGVKLSCDMCGLSGIKGYLPSPLGTVNIAWKNDKKGISLEAEVPDGIIVNIDLNSKDLINKKLISLNGNDILISTLTGNIMTIEGGRHTLRFY